MPSQPMYLINIRARGGVFPPVKPAPNIPPSTGQAGLFPVDIPLGRRPRFSVPIYLLLPYLVVE